MNGKVSSGIGLLIVLIAGASFAAFRLSHKAPPSVASTVTVQANAAPVVAATSRPSATPPANPDAAPAQPPMPEVVESKDPDLTARLTAGRTTYSQMCILCHGVDGKGAPLPGGGGTMAPPLAGSKRATGDPRITMRVLLHGLSGRHDNGTYYPNEMIAFAPSGDDWIANVLTYVRSAFGNHASPVTAEDVAAVHKATDDRSMPYTVQELSDLKLGDDEK